MGNLLPSLIFPQHGQFVQLMQAQDSTAAIRLVSIIQIITKLHSTQIQMEWVFISFWDIVTTSRRGELLLMK